MNFPVSIKGVLVEAGRVVLLEKERAEWELPGGRLEPCEAPEDCLVREFAEELGVVVDVARIIDCWVFEVLPQREVVIVTYRIGLSAGGRWIRTSSSAPNRQRLASSEMRPIDR